MKKIIRILLCFAVFLALQSSRLWGQITIMPLPHQEGVFTLDNIWAVNFTNPLQGPVQAQLEISVEDANHRVILTGVSPTFTVQRGVNRANISAGSVSLTFGNIPGARTLRSTGRFPYGNFTICYQLAGEKGTLGSYCQEETVRPFSPPELISPYNQEEISTLYPMLTWKPPFPPGDAPVLYDLILVEIKNQQSPVEALEKNAPLLNLTGLTVTNLLYPGGAVKLEYDKKYAWQIFAHSGDFNLGQTEVWVFKPVENTEKTTSSTDDGYYPLLNAPNNGYRPIHFQTLRFQLENRYSTTALSVSPPSTGNNKVIYEIYPEGDRSAQVVMTPPSDVTLTPGANKITLTLSGTGFVNNKKYLLLVRDVTGKEYFLDFTYNDN